MRDHSLFHQRPAPHWRAGEPSSRPRAPPEGLGSGLGLDDMAAAGQMLRDFTERSLLPKLEERIARLNLSVTGTYDRAVCSPASSKHWLAPIIISTHK